MASDNRKFLVRFRRKPKGIKHIVMWRHSTESSSWWADEVVWAESAEQAVQRVAGYMDFEKHTSYRRDNGRMAMRVFTVPLEYEEFLVGPTLSVEARHGN